MGTGPGQQVQGCRRRLVRFQEPDQSFPLKIRPHEPVREQRWPLETVQLITNDLN
jgi:hypothetical protein